MKRTVDILGIPFSNMTLNETTDFLEKHLNETVWVFCIWEQPILNETTKIEEVVYQENTYTVTYSFETEVYSHGPTVAIDPPKNEDIEVWTEGSSADHYITLIKDWETEEGNMRSYWKYKYIPQSNEIELVESEDNDYKIYE